MIYEKFEDIKRVIRCHKWKKDRQHKRRRTDNTKEEGQTTQKKKDRQLKRKRTDNSKEKGQKGKQQQQNTTQKTKD